MTYQDWYSSFIIKREGILQKLKDCTLEEIVEYFNYDNLIETEPDFCVLFKEGKKCHNIDNLNCYHCGCPYFVYSDDGLSTNDSIITYSTCLINAKEGSQFKTNTSIHQDCSNCTIPHSAQFTLKSLKS